MPRGPQLTTIYWRDIPAQVNAKSRGRGSDNRAAENRAQVLLKPRFQKAIDRAAMKADITTASDYVAEWRTESTSLDAGLDHAEVEAAAWALAGELDAAFPLTRLDTLVENGGWDPASTDPASSTDPVQPDPEPSNDPGAPS